MKLEFDPKRFEKLFELLSKNNIILIPGPALVGKTSFLHKLKDLLLQKARKVQWIEDIGYLPSGFEKTEQIYLVDDIDQKPELWKQISQGLKSPQSKCQFVLTCSSLPEVSAAFLYQTKIYPLSGLNRRELRRLLPELPEDRVGELSWLTEGHPFLVYYFQFESLRSGHFDDLKAKRLLVETLIERMDPESRDQLFIFYLLKYSDGVSQELIENLPASERAWLTHFKLLDTKPHFQISNLGRKIFSSFLDHTISSKEIIEKTIGFLSKKMDFLSRKDKVWLLLQKDDLDEAVQEFCKIGQEIYLRGEYADYIELTNKIYNKIPLTLFLLRQECFISFSRESEALKETEDQIQINTAPDDHQALLHVQSLCLFKLGRSTEAIACIQRALSFSNHTEVYVRCLLAKSFFITRLDPQQALSLTDEAEAIIRQHSFDGNTEAELCFQRGLIYDLLHQKSEALFCYREAQRIFSVFRNKWKELLCGLNVANLEFDAGNMKEFLSLLNYVENESQKFQLPVLLKACVLSRSIYLAACGKLNEAKNLILHQVESPDTYKHRIDYLLLRRLCYFHLHQESYGEARALVGQMLTPDLRDRDPQDYLVLRYLGELADIGLLKNFRHIPRLIEQTLESDISVAHKMGVLICAMELNLRFYLPTSIREFMPKIESLLRSRYEIDTIIHLKLLCGFYNLIYKSERKAFQLLSEAQLSSKEVSFHSLFYKSSVFLSLYHLRKKATKLALSRIKEAKRSASEHRSRVEQDLAVFCEVICEVQNDKRTQIEPLLDALNASAYIQYRLNDFLGRASHSYPHDISTFEVQFFDQLFDLVRLEKTNVLMLTSTQGSELIPEDRVSRYPVHSYDVVVDEINGKVRVGHRQIAFKRQNLLINLLCFLLKNSGRYISKEELCIQVWHENYNPIVHDQRIYTAIRRLRNMVKVKNLILSKAGSYSISKSIRFLIFSKNENHSFSDRQSWILRFIETNGSSSRMDIEKALRISSSSCKSDLKFLIESSKIEAFGRGKNTRYRRL